MGAGGRTGVYESRRNPDITVNGWSRTLTETVRNYASATPSRHRCHYDVESELTSGWMNSPISSCYNRLLYNLPFVASRLHITKPDVRGKNKRQTILRRNKIMQVQS